MLGLATLVHGLVLHPTTTSRAFGIGMLSAHCLTMLATTFGAGAVLVTLRRRRAGDTPH